MPRMTGSCRCGQVRYTADAEPIFTGICHCTDCQKESGGAFSVVVAVPQSALSIVGSPTTYASTGGSGKRIVSRFCANCGSPLASEAEILPGISMIRAGTLDDRSWLNPTAEIFCDSAQPWVQLGGGMQRFRNEREPALVSIIIALS
jgi:hypothetical protein